MLRRTPAIFFALLTLCQLLSSMSWAQEIAIVQSARIAPYEEAIRGFQAQINKTGTFRGTKSIQPRQTTTFHLDTAGETDQLAREIGNLQPDIILAVGNQALEAVRDERAPIVYLMVSGAWAIIEGRHNITGIEMIVDPALQFKTIRRYLPDTKKLGVIYSSSKTGFLVKTAKDAANRSDLQIIAIRCDSPKDVNPALNTLRGKIDGLWMTPDSTVLTPTTLELFSLFSLTNKIPLIAFSTKYLQHGAALAIYAKPFDMGEQAALMTVRLLAGETAGHTEPAYNTTATALSNREILDKLGLPFINPDASSKE